MSLADIASIVSMHARKEEASCSTFSATSFCELGVPIAHRMCLWITGGSKEPVSVVVDVDAAFAATNDRPCPKGGLYLSHREVPSLGASAGTWPTRSSSRPARGRGSCSSAGRRSSFGTMLMWTRRRGSAAQCCGARVSTGIGRIARREHGRSLSPSPRHSCSSTPRAVSGGSGRACRGTSGVGAEGGAAAPRPRTSSACRVPSLYLPGGAYSIDQAGVRGINRNEILFYSTVTNEPIPNGVGSL
jgi:hypothetical protein